MQPRGLALLLGLCGSVFAQSKGYINTLEYAVPTALSLQEGAITTGPDQALWFTEPVANQIARITTSGKVTEYPVPTPGAQPTGITKGPDGALWFTEIEGNQVGRITIQGQITEYSIPTANSGCYWITSGPDGALWFTESYAGQIARITTDGQVTEFPVGIDPGEIATGSDGALWFTGGYFVGRLTTAGQLTGTFPVSGVTFGITSGPDGALWFTETENHTIGRVTTQGQVTEYLTPTEGNKVSEITAGPDGALWFSETQAVRIGRVTTSGVITEYAYSVRSGGEGITAGPDGGIWFLGYGSPVIGRVQACGLGLSASFTGSTLTMNFDLGIDTPATFDVRLHSSTGVSQPISRSIPAVVPPHAFSLMLKNVPDLGEVTVEPLLTTSSGTPYCAETAIVNTAQ